MLFLLILVHYNLTLPNTDGNSGEFLTTDGSGSLSWAPAEAATSVSAGAGAVGTPSMSFSTDTNTGFYSNNMFSAKSWGCVTRLLGFPMPTIG